MIDSHTKVFCDKIPIYVVETLKNFIHRKFILLNRVWHEQIISCTIVTDLNNFKCHWTISLCLPPKDYYFFGALTKINTSNAWSDATHWTNISPHSRVFYPLEVFVFRQSWYAAYLRGSCIVKFKCSTYFRLSTSANIREDISHLFIYLKEKKVISQTLLTSEFYFNNFPCQSQWSVLWVPERK